MTRYISPVHASKESVRVIVLKERREHRVTLSFAETKVWDISYNVIHDVLVLFTFAQAKVEMISFDTLVSDQGLALLHVLHVN